MKVKNNILVFLGIAIPAFLVFRAFFSTQPLAWGDAPHFWPEELKELVKEPFAWTSRGINFGGVNRHLWLSPLMFLYGLLQTVFGLGNDLIIRILFYFPSVILAFAGPVFLVRYLGYSRKVQFFASLFYGLNSYFILLVDGGQVGVALAYAIFPLALLFLKKLIDVPSHKTFFSAILLSFLLTMADPRIGLIGIFTVLVWGALARQKKLKYLIPLVGALIGLSSYWLVPLFRLGEGLISLDVSRLQLSSLLNGLTVFQPHWPENIFGKISPPPFYFIGIPLLIFWGLLLAPKRKTIILALLFLIFAFLVKGNTPPLGGWYDFLIEKVSFGASFRDSSKFFVPLTLFAGILIGITADKFKNRLFSLLIYSYLLFLVSPALLGNLNFVLSNRARPSDFQKIYENLKDEVGFVRTVWFPERHPLTFELVDKPALDAKELVSTRPFADINVGTYDAFNFIHNEKFLDWFKLLGIKYLVFSGDPRVVRLNEEQQRNRDDLLARVATQSGLVRQEWGTDVPIYKVAETKPRMFAVDKLAAVVGGPFDSAQGKLPYPAIYFEDGKLEPTNLEGVASESASLVFNGKDEIDLTMSFLQDYFVGPAASKSDWAYYGPADYLIAKYQLLIRGIETNEFDYEMGVAFSTQGGETIEFSLATEDSGEYILAVRSMIGPDGVSLKYELDTERGELEWTKEGAFSWFIKPVKLGKGKHKLVLTNPGGLQVINTVALVPNKDFAKAQSRTETFIEHFGTVEADSLIDKSDWSEFSFEKVSPVRYKVTAPESANWIVFTDSYHPKWKLKQGNLLRDGLPFYSMVNGFYIKPSWTKTEIVFEGQKQVRWGIYYSAISALILGVIFLWFYPAKRRAGLKKR